MATALLVLFSPILLFAAVLVFIILLYTVGRIEIVGDLFKVLAAPFVFFGLAIGFSVFLLLLACQDFLEC